MGAILKVKPLATLAMIDEEELDWKIVAISLDDPRASLVNDLNDVEKHFPVSLILSIIILNFRFFWIYRFNCWNILVLLRMCRFESHGKH